MSARSLFLRGLRRRPRMAMPAAIVAAFVAAWLILGALLDGPDDIQAEADTHADLQAAILQAASERPDLWTPERVQNGLAAAKVAAKVNVPTPSTPQP